MPGPAAARPGRARLDGPTYRLIPSRFPPVQAFASVSDPDDLQAVMELEGWTNDRLVAERLARLPREDWVFGSPCASVVMASFLHAAPAGQRFTGPALGAWYAACAVVTAILEVAHHLRREALNAGMSEMRGGYRTYVAALQGSFHDIRGMAAVRPELYAPDSYAASRDFGEAVRAAGGEGIVYDSLRHRGGTCVVAYRPRRILEVVQAEHYELTVPLEGRVIARQLSA